MQETSELPTEQRLNVAPTTVVAVEPLRNKNGSLKKPLGRKPKPRTYTAAELQLKELYETFAFKCAKMGIVKEQCVNFVKGMGFLQDKQLLFAKACRECDRDGGPTMIGFGGARGGGKSHVVLTQVGMDDCQRFPGIKVLYLRKVGKANKEQFDDYRKKLFGRFPHDYAEYKGKLVFENGSLIIVGHFQNEKDIDMYLGLEYDLIVIEEATTLTYSKMKNILTCLRSSKPGWRPRAYLSTNPGGVGHAWFKQMFLVPCQLNRETSTRFIPATVHDNKHVNKDYIGVLESLTGWQRRAWLDGDWDVCAGQFFTNWREEVHVVDRVDESRAKRWFAALDYGFTHYTVCLLGFSDENGNIFIVDEHAKRQMVVVDHAFHIKSMLSLHNVMPYDLEYFAAGKDCFSKKEDGTTIADDYRACGVDMIPAEMDRQNGWARLLKVIGDPDSGVKPTLFVHRRCVGLIERIPLMQHDVNKPEDVEKVDTDDNGTGGDDHVDVLRYLLSSNPITQVAWAKPVDLGGWQNVSTGDVIDAQWAVV